MTTPVEREPSRGFLWMVCLVAAMGGLLFGYDWVVIGGAKPFYEPCFDLTGDDRAWMAGWTMSSALAGCLAGALIAAGLTDRFGRKPVLIGAAVLFAASAAWTAMALSLTGFVAARIIGGLGIGLASTVSPLYLAEVSPPQSRGLMVSINQLTIVIGVLAAQIVNLGIYQIEPIAKDALPAEILASWNGQQGWRWMFAAELFPSGLFFLLALVIPESPAWLLREERAEDARSVFARLGGEAYAAERIAEHRAAHAHAHAQQSQEATFSELWRSPVVGIVGFGVFIAAFQQWCGINVIFNYAEEVFRAAGYDISGLMWNIVITGAVNLGFTLVAMNTVDRLGRRPLMLLGAGGLCVIYAIIGACYYAQVTGVVMLLLVLAAIACYATTLAPITWVLLSEVFPSRVRGTAMSVCVAVLWIACFFLTVSFKPINVAVGAAGTFWLYGAICGVGFVFLYAFTPETKGRSLEEIERQLTRDQS